MRTLYKSDSTQTQTTQKMKTGTGLSLLVDSPTIHVGDTVRITVNADGVKEPVSASDIVLRYDTTRLSFVKATAVSSSFSVVRIISDKGMLVISGIDDESTTQSIVSKKGLINVEFSVLQKGEIIIKPVLSDTGITSTLLYNTSTKNQLMQVTNLTLSVL